MTSKGMQPWFPMLTYLHYLKSYFGTGGYDLEIGQFLEVASMVVTWWIVAFCAVQITASSDTSITCKKLTILPFLF